MSWKDVDSEVNKVFNHADPWQISIIESLAQTACVTFAINFDLTSEEAREAIAYLKDNQVCPIMSGHAYSQTDILRKLNQLNNKL